ncbi:12900_t:CDS:2, partial [Ambispora gerdemannii]
RAGTIEIVVYGHFHKEATQKQMVDGIGTIGETIKPFIIWPLKHYSAGKKENEKNFEIKEDVSQLQRYRCMGFKFGYVSKEQRCIIDRETLKDLAGVKVVLRSAQAPSSEITFPLLPPPIRDTCSIRERIRKGLDITVKLIKLYKSHRIDTELALLERL